MVRLIIEEECEHGHIGSHWSAPDWSSLCSGGSRREVTINRLQTALDVVIDNLLPEGQGMAIDVEQVVALSLGDRNSE